MSVDHYLAILLWLPQLNRWRVIWRLSFRKKNNFCSSILSTLPVATGAENNSVEWYHGESSLPQPIVFCPSKSAGWLLAAAANDADLAAGRPREFHDFASDYLLSENSTFVIPSTPLQLKGPHGVEDGTQPGDPSYAECWVCPLLRAFVAAAHALQYCPEDAVPSYSEEWVRVPESASNPSWMQEVSDASKIQQRVCIHYVLSV
eukprot:TRINITY_DN52699_c0_g1_i1.p1 TRINITY_DN52699_c0_g1~~TRINITY_DN52699_c0_g1_i1.p1  ORF type:complete len:204 (+),score=8.42 TRINITY_DN52699_c0_g1_i1:128-739(+)